MSPYSTKINAHRLADLAVLVILAGLVGYYCVDAMLASTDILNLIFVLPVAVIVLALCLLQFVLAVPKLREPIAAPEPASAVVPVIVLFAAYVLALPWFGFDTGTFLFLSAYLWLHGERRWSRLLAYSFTFALSLSLFFSQMLPFPMPMLLLDAGGG